MLFIADVRQNFTLKEVNLENKNKKKKLSPKSWKHGTKVYANRGLSLSAFEQPGPGPFLESPENISGPKSHLWNCQPRVMESRSFNIFSR